MNESADPGTARDDERPAERPSEPVTVTEYAVPEVPKTVAAENEDLDEPGPDDDAPATTPSIAVPGGGLIVTAADVDPEGHSVRR